MLAAHRDGVRLSTFPPRSLSFSLSPSIHPSLPASHRCRTFNIPSGHIHELICALLDACVLCVAREVRCGSGANSLAKNKNKNCKNNIRNLGEKKNNLKTWFKIKNLFFKSISSLRKSTPRSVIFTVIAANLSIYACNLAHHCLLCPLYLSQPTALSMGTADEGHCLTLFMSTLPPFHKHIRTLLQPMVPMTGKADF